MLGGVAGGVIGTIVGAGIASVMIEGQSVSDVEVLGKAFLAGIVIVGFETAGVATGVHRGNKRLGSFGWDFAASFGGLLVGPIVVIMLFRRGTGLALPMAYIVQVSATVLVERLTASRKLRARRP